MLQNRFKPLLLQGCDPVTLAFRLAIGEGQVAVNPAELDLIQLPNRRCQPWSFFPVATQARHPRVQFQLDTERTPTATGEVLAEQRFAHAAQGWHQLPVQAGSQLLRLGEVSQHQNGLIQSGLPEFDPFLQRGHTELAGAAH